MRRLQRRLFRPLARRRRILHLRPLPRQRHHRFPSRHPRISRRQYRRQYRRLLRPHILDCRSAPLPPMRAGSALARPKRILRPTARPSQCLGMGPRQSLCSMPLGHRQTRRVICPDGPCGEGTLSFPQRAPRRSICAGMCPTWYVHRRRRGASRADACGRRRERCCASCGCLAD
jgi:hypothetical protein